MPYLNEIFNPSNVPQIPTFDHLPDIPAITRLKSRRQWVSWQFEYREGSEKPTKPPISPKSGRHASHSRPWDWSDYTDAVARTIKSGLEGVGYVLTADDGLSGGDLDNCRNADTGEIEPWAQEIVNFAETYVEISPSGEGLRILWEGKVPEAIKCNAANVEVYGRQRYLTITGWHLDGTPVDINPAPKTEAALRARVAQFKSEKPAENLSSIGYGGNDFFRKVNTASLADLRSWVSSIFPMAKFQPGTGAWRIPARTLGDSFQEDLSISPQGIVYFGVHDMGDARLGRRTPIDLMIDHGGSTDAVDAAMRLCKLIGRDPALFGWHDDNAKKGAKFANQLLSGARNPKEFDATPWTYIDPLMLARRQWLYSKHYMRKFITTTISPGGIGKTSLVISEAVAMVTGKPILGVYPDELARVWFWNGEDPMEELKRRILACCQLNGIDQSGLDGLFVDSGRNTEIVLVEEQKSGTKLCVPLYENVINTILRHKIDVLIVDPFVSCHRVNENDNNAIDLVAKAWARIADITNCSIELVHHARKTGGQEVTIEHARGAVALISASRSARVLNGMSEEEAERAGPDHVRDRRQFFRIDNGKANLALPPNRSSWVKLESVRLPNGDGGLLDNGDEVGVPTPWEWPDAFKDVQVTGEHLAEAQRRIGTEPMWRENIQSSNWVGHALGDLFGLNSMAPAGRARLAAIIKSWLESGGLKIINADDNKRMNRRWIISG